MRGEFAAIAALAGLLPAFDEPGGIGIGDDAAVVILAGPGPTRLLLAADTVVAGVHADLSLTTAADLGWKAMAASISDLAAMGGDPGHALVTVAGPPGAPLLGLYEGIAAAARDFGCPVVGGDLTNASELVVTVAVTGTCDGPPVTRAGARPGDDIWVTGPLGASAAGLRLLRTGGGDRPADQRDDAIRAHARPVPQLAAGRAARRAGATAMIDISDGLSADLGHVADASGVGVALDSVPVHPAATLEEALGGGEDFALAFTASPGAGMEEAFAGLYTPIRIGRCTADRAVRTLAGRPLPAVGWEHAWDSGGTAPSGGSGGATR